MSETVYRVQDIEGRGPYRPGFSHKWSDGFEKPPAFYEEFGWDILKAAKKGEAMGCGFRTRDQAHQWFSREEMDRLRVLGYHLVRIEVDRILAESKHQLVFARSKPLALDVVSV